MIGAARQKCASAVQELLREHHYSKGRIVDLWKELETLRHKIQDAETSVANLQRKLLNGRERLSSLQGAEKDLGKKQQEERDALPEKILEMERELETQKGTLEKLREELTPAMKDLERRIAWSVENLNQRIGLTRSECKRVVEQSRVHVQREPIVPRKRVKKPKKTFRSGLWATEEEDATGKKVWRLPAPKAPQETVDIPEEAMNATGTIMRVDIADRWEQRFINEKMHEGVALTTMEQRRRELQPQIFIPGAPENTLPVRAARLEFARLDVSIGLLAEGKSLDQVRALWQADITPAVLPGKMQEFLSLARLLRPGGDIEAAVSRSDIATAPVPTEKDIAMWKTAAMATEALCHSQISQAVSCLTLQERLSGLQRMSLSQEVFGQYQQECAGAEQKALSIIDGLLTQVPADQYSRALRRMIEEYIRLMKNPAITVSLRLAMAKHCTSFCNLLEQQIMPASKIPPSVPGTNSNQFFI